MEAVFSNNHHVTPRYIIQLYSPSFETDEPMYLSNADRMFGIYLGIKRFGKLNHLNMRD